MLSFIKKLIPKPLFRAYHFCLAALSALVYGFPSKKIIVVGVTGTKGKSTTVELINAILENAGYKTAVVDTVRFKIGNNSEPNLFKMTMPGRFFLQEFLRKAVEAHCQYAIVEMSSEGARQFRHRFIAINSLIFTNLAPEHIESHGSFEKYREAKLSIAKHLSRVSKKDRSIIVNRDDKEYERFLKFNIPEKYTFSLKDAEPYTTTDHSSMFTVDGVTIRTNLPGEFNIRNMLGTIAYAKTQSIDIATIANALENYSGTRGRMERITLPEKHPLHKKQNFTVIVDYAHTPESLREVYKVFKNQETICILGNTGGGRDTWKRAEMAKIADGYCSRIILANEDPYDEDPMKIINEMKVAIKKHRPEIILDRREAIHEALKKAKNYRVGPEKTGVAVLITGKGTDPYIMGPNGTKQEWDDATVVREELVRLLGSRP